MNLLLDTNIFLEILLEQEKSREAMLLIKSTELHEFFISDYSLHSIGLLLFRRKKHDIFIKFINDIIINVGIRILTLQTDDMESLSKIAQRFHLDFDDAYQYLVAEKYRLTIVSFDTDFDHTKTGKKTPTEILQKID